MPIYHPLLPLSCFHFAVFRVSAKSSGNDYPALAFPMGFSGDPNKDKKKVRDRADELRPPAGNADTLL